MKNTNDTKRWRDYIATGTGKKIWQFLIKLNLHLSYDPAILFFNLHSWEIKNGEKKPYTSVYNSFSPNHQKLEIIFLQEVDKHWNPTWQEKKKWMNCWYKQKYRCGAKENGPEKLRGILCDFTSRTFWKRKTRWTEKNPISICPGQMEERGEEERQRGMKESSRVMEQF